MGQFDLILPDAKKRGNWLRIGKQKESSSINHLNGK